MKKSIIMLLILCMSLVAMGCGDSKYINGVKYETYGFFNKEEVRNENIKYRLVTGNVIWSVILCETVAFPVYFVGFSLYEPVGVKGAK